MERRVGKGTTLGHRRVDKRQPNPESTTKTRATLTRPHTKPVHGPTPATRRAFPKRPDPLGSHQYTGLRRPQGELSPSGRILWYTIATRYATAALPKSTRHRLTRDHTRNQYTGLRRSQGELSPSDRIHWETPVHGPTPATRRSFLQAAGSSGTLWHYV
jgi:hypothetical protein